MLNGSKNSVSHVLRECGAELQRAVSFGNGLNAALWHNPAHCPDVIPEYDQPDHHTLSLYLEGGYQVRRIDSREDRIGGAPGKLCLLPAGHESRWYVGDALRMFHLYVDSDYLNYVAQSTLDIDPRHIALCDETFAQAPLLESLVRQVFLSTDWDSRADRLAMDNAAQLMLFELLKNHSSRARDLKLKGGLSPKVKRLLEDYIQAHLGEAVSLEALAAQTDLSPYHLAKMFKISFGMPPHRYLVRKRIDHACALLKEGSDSLVEIALACGFSSQSHFSNSFKTAMGVTPRAYRDL